MTRLLLALETSSTTRTSPVRPTGEPHEVFARLGGGAGQLGPAEAAAAERWVEARLAEAEGRLAEASARGAEWELEARNLRDELSNVEVELGSRPTVRAMRDLSIKVAELESNLADERRRAKETLWSHHRVHKHTSPTRDAISRDKAIAALGGVDIESMAPVERNTLLIDCCRRLGVSSIHAVHDALAQVCAVAATVAPLESFVRSVRKIVSSGASNGRRPGSAPMPESPGVTPRKVLSTLKGWADERSELAALRMLRDELGAQLGRLHGTVGDKKGEAEAEAEAEANAEAKAEAKAEAETESEAEGQAGAARGQGAGGRAGGRAGGHVGGRRVGGHAGGRRAGGARGGFAGGSAEAELARLVAEALGDEFAEAAAAAGGLSSGAVCAALREMVGAADAESALRRVRELCNLEREIRSQTAELALMLGLPVESKLSHCVARKRVDDAQRGEAQALIDRETAQQLLLRLRAHDGVSALANLVGLDTYMRACT